TSAPQRATRRGKRGSSTSGSSCSSRTPRGRRGCASSWPAIVRRLRSGCGGRPIATAGGGAPAGGGRRGGGPAGGGGGGGHGGGDGCVGTADRSDEGVAHRGRGRE